MVKVKAHKAISSSFMSGLGDKKEVIGKHEMAEIMRKRRVETGNKSK